LEPRRRRTLRPIDRRHRRHRRPALCACHCRLKSISRGVVRLRPPSLLPFPATFLLSLPPSSFFLLLLPPPSSSFFSSSGVKNPVILQTGVEDGGISLAPSRVSSHHSRPRIPKRIPPGASGINQKGAEHPESPQERSWRLGAELIKTSPAKKWKESPRNSPRIPKRPANPRLAPPGPAPSRESGKD